ncbi:sensor histidine kinase [Alicyclobacillus acidiphilus]|uniref:sensor histidine kinase n=1 Tax=Alicyclobacillus acidiphilus TaxID=182455 RepID=UPI0012EE7009|nr:HAMP domain-containing sensor histidine kinase [Alicyclobacillus acidiphilus]
MLIGVFSSLCTLFTFQIGPGTPLNFALVCLTWGFFLLPWSRALVSLVIYMLCQITMSFVLLTEKGDSAQQVTHIVVSGLKHSILTVIVFAVFMSITSWILRNQSAFYRGMGMVVALCCYGAFDYIYTMRTLMRAPLNAGDFAWFLAIVGAAVASAVRVTVGGYNARIMAENQVRLEKSELVSQLAASVAHEIRNPITVVRGFTQLLASKEFDRKTAVGFYSTMVEELDRAESIIGEYLNIAKSPLSDDETNVNLSVLVTGAVQALQPYALNKNVDLQSTVCEEAVIRGNYSTILQAVINVIKNAIEACTDKESASVKVHLSKVKAKAELTVVDTGSGMSKTTLDKLGQPYYSTKSQGTGLGLTLTYKVIHELGGKIVVHSEVGLGTTFSIIFPLAENVLFKTASVGVAQLQADS